MDTKTFILGLLMTNSMTGYDIKKTFSMSFSFFSGLSYGSIYPALKKMETDKAITMNIQVQENAPNKKVYTITDKGREIFIESLKKPVVEDKMRSSFLSKLFFFSEIGQVDRIVLAKQYQEIIDAKEEDLKAVNYAARKTGDAFQQINYEFGLRFFNDLSNNIQETIKKLEEIDNGSDQ
ncbi:MAG: PadR family transcriptional regulator [Desulfobacteraceae bacterium]|nr:PadR family transcriptional regulator [Desulfobacteraceae bacterium]